MTKWLACLTEPHAIKEIYPIATLQKWVPLRRGGIPDNSVFDDGTFTANNRMSCHESITKALRRFGIQLVR